MTWAPVTMRWPEQATQWMGQLSAAKDLAGGELASTATRLAGLDGLATTNPGPGGAGAYGGGGGAAGAAIRKNGFALTWGGTNGASTTYVKGAVV